MLDRGGGKQAALGRQGGHLMPSHLGEE